LFFSSAPSIFNSAPVHRKGRSPSPEAAAAAAALSSFSPSQPPAQSSPTLRHARRPPMLPAVSRKLHFAGGTTTLDGQQHHRRVKLEHGWRDRVDRFRFGKPSTSPALSCPVLGGYCPGCRGYVRLTPHRGGLQIQLPPEEPRPQRPLGKRMSVSILLLHLRLLRLLTNPPVSGG